MRYACIDAHRARFAVALMCRVLRVSRSGYHAWRARCAVGYRSAHAQRDAQLRAAIHAAYLRSRRTYGAPRVHAELHAQGERVARKRIARLMREEALVARRTRRYPSPAPRPAAPLAPNVLARCFAPTAIATLNRVWVADITYLPTGEGWLYMAVVLDLASRRVIGWAMRATLTTELATAALAMALGRRRPAPGALHHSDRGSQYTSAAYRAMLAAAGFTQSMSAAGECYDNAVAESFFATLEAELGAGAHWPTRATARAAVFEYVETWYNHERRHSVLGYVSPVTYEQHLSVAAD